MVMTAKKTSEGRRSVAMGYGSEKCRRRRRRHSGRLLVDSTGDKMPFLLRDADQALVDLCARKANAGDTRRARCYEE